MEKLTRFSYSAGEGTASAGSNVQPNAVYPSGPRGGHDVTPVSDSSSSFSFISPLVTERGKR